MTTAFETLNWSVQLDPGSPVTITGIVVAADVDLTTEGGGRASATIVCTEYPDDFGWRVPLYIYASREGGTPPIVFNGECMSIKGDGRGRFVITATDYLARLDFPWSKEVRSYTAEDASAVRQNLVEASGIDPSLTDIQAPAGWDVGVVNPVLLNEGDSPAALIQELDRAQPLWRTWTRPNGAIKSAPVAIGTSVKTYTRGSAPVIEMEWDDQITDGIVNACKVVGALYNDVPVEALYQASSPYIPDPPEYVTEVLQSYLIEDPTRAAFVAEEVVTFKNTLQANGRVLVALDPEVEPGDTITLDDPDGYVSVANTKAWITAIRHSIPACTTEITTGLIYL